MGVSEYDSFRERLVRLLQLVDEQHLDPIRSGILAEGVRLARKVRQPLSGSAQHLPGRSRELGDEILAMLASADASPELTAVQRTELGYLVYFRLPLADEPVEYQVELDDGSGAYRSGSVNGRPPVGMTFEPDGRTRVITWVADDRPSARAEPADPA